MQRLRLSRLSLRWRLLLLLGAVASLLVADRVREIVAHRAELVAFGRTQLLQQARLGALKQADVISDVRSILQVTAEMGEASARNDGACRLPYQRAVEAMPWLTALAVVTRDGSLACSAPEMPPGLNLADRDYFRRALQTRQFALSDFLLDRTDGRPAIVAAMPRIVAGEVETVLAARIDLGWLDRLAASVAEGQGTFVILTDATGTAVAAFPEGGLRIGESVRRLGLWTVAGDERGDFEQVSRDGHDMLFASATLPTGGRIYVGSPRAAILAPAERETALAAAKMLAALLVCAALLWFGTDRVVLRPVEALVATAGRLGAGDLSARAATVGPTPEMRHLALAFNEMAERLSARAEELRAVNASLARLATVDALTGLSNRRLFDERLAQEWRRAARSGRPLGLILVDVDCFKAFNDTYGHPEGDSCLCRVARSLEDGRRAEDLSARVGGEEFAILLPGADVHAVALAARRLRVDVEALAIPHMRNASGIVTISVGAASQRPSRPEGADALVAQADGALYAAKRSGRNRVEIAEGPDAEPVRRLAS